VSGGTASVTTLTTSSTVTINGGTANGVAYLDGSKVLTTGTALTFDGTTFGSSQVNATNGIVVSSATVSANYTIPSGSNAMSAGPVTINSGITVTVSSGSVWTVV
jgi:hypothetical protein